LKTLQKVKIHNKANPRAQESPNRRDATER